MTHEGALPEPGRAPPARRRFRLDTHRARLISGLILFVFALTHFVNHALGLVSVEWMEAAQSLRRAVWRSPPGTVLLYGALIVHVVFGLWRLVRRTTWRMPVWEAVQIGLGLLIPIWLLQHVIATRGMALTRGFDDTYGDLLRVMWPANALSQSALLLIVWVHAAIGVHHWLATKRWYRRFAPWLLGLAVLIPVLAVAGWIEAARRVVAADAGPYPWTREDYLAAIDMIERAYRGLTAIMIAAGIALITSRVISRLRRRVAIHYADGRTVRIRPGSTLLEISRAHGVPHASICGGRARCTTCRVLVLDGASALPAPAPVERKALDRIAAPERVRLACQIRPASDLTVRPLVPLAEAEETGLRHDPYRWGVERRITVMFTDLRGFTKLSERLYPYDSVFLLNRYFDVMAGIVRRHGGRIDKFMGDGIMALFGIDAARGAGGRDAILAAKAMHEALHGLNEEFRSTLAEPLRMGVGVHTGPAVLGRVGASAARAGSELTALGDTVNTASRLESLTKDFGALAVISDAALTASGLSLSGVETHDIPVRGRGGTVHIHVVTDFSALAEAAPKSAVTA